MATGKQQYVTVVILVSQLKEEDHLQFVHLLHVVNLLLEGLLCQT